MLADEGALVAAAYDAALDLTLWPAVLSGLKALVDADAVIELTAELGASSVVHTAVKGDIGGAGVSEEVAHQYAALAPISPIAFAVVSAPDATLKPAFELITRQEFERSDFYDRWVRPNAMKDALLGPIARDGSTRTVLNLMRTSRARARFDDGTSALTRVVPHLSRALRIGRRLQSAEQEGWSKSLLTNALSIAVVCLARNGQALWMNSAAETLMRSNDGLSLTRDRHLIATFPRASASLKRLITNSIKGIGCAVAIERPSERLSYCLSAVPFDTSRHIPGVESSMANGNPVAVLAIHDPDRTPAAREDMLVQERLRELYGLTAAEAMVAALIVRMNGVNEVSKALGVTYSTVHTLLNRVFRKMSVNSQVGVARHVTSLAVLL